MKKLLVFLPVLLLVGCANGSPIDFLIPARRPSPATTEYLGHLYQTNNVNSLYYSVSDAQINKALVPIRKMELQGLYYAAKGETELLEGMGSMTSNLIWGAIIGAVGLTGWMAPRPQEKAKITEALHSKPPNAI